MRENNENNSLYYNNQISLPLSWTKEVNFLNL